MPTYDYQCRECGNTIEVIHSMLEEGPQTCERCGGQLRRILHPAGIIFRGSGFYKTDSRRSGSETSGSPGSGSKPSGETSGSKTSDASSSKSEPASAKDSSGGSSPAAPTST